jgi:hypothetical protein
VIQLSALLLLLAPAQAAPTPVAPPAPAAIPAAPPAASTTTLPAAPFPSYLGLANHLKQDGQFDACAVEALRHGYLHPDEAPVANERAALCLELAGRYEDARRTLLQLEDPATLDAHSRFRLCYSEVFLSGVPSSELCNPPRGPAASREEATYLLMASYTRVMKPMLERRYGDAAKELAAWPKIPPGTLANWQAQDRHFVEDSGQLAHRSPWLAGLLSAVLPGAGRGYIGRWGDGVFSFILIGTTGGLAAYEFDRSGVSSVGGWILASIGTLFYLGDIYGSAVGAEIFNRQQAEALAGQVKEAYVGRADP